MTADWLALLDYGTFEVAEDGRRIPIRGYVVRSGEHVVLVDTGFPHAYYEDAEEAGRLDGLDAFGHLVSIGPQNRPQEQLALLGLASGDVTKLVLTHGDIDHVGGMHHFPDATLVMSSAERRAGPPRYYGDLRPLEWPTNTHSRDVDGDEEIAPGLTLLATPGHSPGHLSLLVELAETGTVILACDAISREHEVATGVNGGSSDDEAARRSANRLVELADERRALLVYGHDPEQSRTLRRAPETYR
ncbi:MAG TPA: N-acyl homoserine lactonase family protein [Gaiellaceae bacterium]|nr:N-acyl homoserine lactonase family protein [Gaiellaceae bacterium]